MKKFRLTIRDEVQKKWSTLSDSLEDDLDDFAKKLFGKGVITKGARKKKDYNAMMDAFVNGMDHLTTVQEYKDHCSTLLAILTDIGGNAGTTGDELKGLWNIAVKKEHGFDFL